MTEDEFRQLVRRMRTVQKKFFRLKPADRPPDLIRHSKALEAMVDAELSATDPQLDLFAGA